MLGLPRTTGRALDLEGRDSPSSRSRSTTTSICTSRGRRCSSACRTRWRSFRPARSRCSARPRRRWAKSSSTSSSATPTRLARDTAALLDLTNVQEYTIKPLLRTVPGVADGEHVGRDAAAVQVSADPAKLAGLRAHAARRRDRAREQQRELRRRVHRGSRRTPDAARTRARRLIRPTSPNVVVATRGCDAGPRPRRRRA